MWIRIALQALSLSLLAAGGARAQEEAFFGVLAGSRPGTDDGLASEAQLYFVTALCVDRQGNILVVEPWRHRIRRISPGGQVSTLAGGSQVDGYRDGVGAVARFAFPWSVTADDEGFVYVGDEGNQVVRRIDPSGRVTVLAGRPKAGGYRDGPADAALLQNPKGVAADASGNLYVATGTTIRRITPDRIVTTMAYLNGNHTWGQEDIAADAQGNAYVANSYWNVILKITPSGQVIVLAGAYFTSGYADGPGPQARFRDPAGVAVDDTGTVYVADSYNGIIRKISPEGLVSTLAGRAGHHGYRDGPAASALFRYPRGVAVDGHGNVFVADTWNGLVRRIAPDGLVSTVAGLPHQGPGEEDESGIWYPTGVAYDAAGGLYVASSVLLRVSAAGTVSLVAGARGQSGTADGVGADARFMVPRSLAVEADGSVLLVDSAASNVRRIRPDGLVSTVSGTGEPGYADGPAASARWSNPYGVAAGANGEIYVADSGNQVIRRISADGVVSTIAGLPGTPGAMDGAGQAARFTFPVGLALEATGSLLVADAGTYAIRRVTPSGVVTTIAGTLGEGGDEDGDREHARLAGPVSVAVDAQGRILFVDSSYRGDRIRMVRPDGSVVTVATGAWGGFEGVGSFQGFRTLGGLATGPGGRIAVSETDGFRICEGVLGVHEEALVDRPVAPVGQPRRLRGSLPDAFESRWRVVRHPATSRETLRVEGNVATFTPDVPDTYVFRLWSRGPSGVSVCEATLQAYLHGDTDLNGFLDVFDVVTLAAALVGNVIPGSPPFVGPAEVGDVIQDGTFDVKDLVELMARIAAGGGGWPPPPIL